MDADSDSITPPPSAPSSPLLRSRAGLSALLSPARQTVGCSLSMVTRTSSFTPDPAHVGRSQSMERMPLSVAGLRSRRTDAGHSRSLDPWLEPISDAPVPDSAPVLPPPPPVAGSALPSSTEISESNPTISDIQVVPDSSSPPQHRILYVSQHDAVDLLGLSGPPPKYRWTVVRADQPNRVGSIHVDQETISSRYRLHPFDLDMHLRVFAGGRFSLVKSDQTFLVHFLKTQCAIITKTEFLLLHPDPTLGPDMEDEQRCINELALLVASVRQPKDFPFAALQATLSAACRTIDMQTNEFEESIELMLEKMEKEFKTRNKSIMRQLKQNFGILKIEVQKVYKVLKNRNISKGNINRMNRDDIQFANILHEAFVKANLVLDRLKKLEWRMQLTANLIADQEEEIQRRSTKYTLNFGAFSLSLGMFSFILFTLFVCFFSLRNLTS